MSSRFTIIAVAAAILATAGCGRARSESGGATVERSFPVAQFERIAVAGSYAVEVRTGSAASVIAKGPEKALDRLVAEVEGGTLRIHPRKTDGFNIGSDWDKVTLVVTVPSLIAADVAGSGGIRIDRIAGDHFSGEIAGSGSLMVDRVEVGELKFSVAGSGGVQAGSGTAKQVDLHIAGSGNIGIKRIVAEKARVSVAGSGNVAANATATADVRIAGSGNVEISGGGQCRVSKQGSGKVRCT